MHVVEHATRAYPSLLIGCMCSGLTYVSPTLHVPTTTYDGHTGSREAFLLLSTYPACHGPSRVSRPVQKNNRQHEPTSNKIPRAAHPASFQSSPLPRPFCRLTSAMTHPVCCGDYSKSCTSAWVDRAAPFQLCSCCRPLPSVVSPCRQHDEGSSEVAREVVCAHYASMLSSRRLRLASGLRSSDASASLCYGGITSRLASSFPGRGRQASRLVSYCLPGKASAQLAWSVA